MFYVFNGRLGGSMQVCGVWVSTGGWLGFLGCPGTPTHVGGGAGFVSVCLRQPRHTHVRLSAGIPEAAICFLLASPKYQQKEISQKNELHCTKDSQIKFGPPFALAFKAALCTSEALGPMLVVKQCGPVEPQ